MDKLSSKRPDVKIKSNLNLKRAILVISVLVLLATGYLLVASPMIAAPRTAGYFLENPHPNEFCFTTKEGGFLTASDRQKVDELSRMIFNRQAKRTNSKYPRDIEHLHLSWGYKGKDFDITRDGRVHIFVGNYEVAHEPLPYRIIFKLHLLVNAKDFVCYESKPNKEVYVKASELLKTAN